MGHEVSSREFSPGSEAFTAIGNRIYALEARVLQVKSINELPGPGYFVLSDTTLAEYLHFVTRAGSDPLDLTVDELLSEVLPKRIQLSAGELSNLQ